MRFVRQLIGPALLASDKLYYKFSNGKSKQIFLKTALCIASC